LTVPSTDIFVEMSLWAELPSGAAANLDNFVGNSGVGDPEPIPPHVLTVVHTGGPLTFAVVTYGTETTPFSFDWVAETNAGTAVNPGTAPLCFEWTLTVTAVSSTVRFANLSEDEPPLTLTGVTVGHTLVAYGSNRTVTDNGADAPALVAPGSGWPALLPGSNDLDVSGGSWSLVYTPLYL
jgi:hypothetical protein